MNVIKMEVLSESEWPVILEWYAKRGITMDMTGLPEETTYLARFNGEMAMCVSMEAPCFGGAYLEALIANPDFGAERRAEVMNVLLAYCEERAKELGAKRLFCMSPSEKLTPSYERLGFKKVAQVTTMIKEIF